MDWVHENADRNFSADAPNEDQANLRDLLKTSEVADYFDEFARIIGQAISRAVFDPRFGS